MNTLIDFWLSGCMAWMVAIATYVASRYGANEPIPVIMWICLALLAVASWPSLVVAGVCILIRDHRASKRKPLPIYLDS